MRKVILTGFEPFDKIKRNPSMEVVNLLKEENFPGISLYTVILPTVYGESSEVLIRHITDLEPSFVISLGVATGRKKISLERFALNIDDAVTKDNKSVKRTGLKIYEDGPHAYRTILPVEKILKELHRYKIKSIISNFCGTFVCNHLMYSILYHIDKNNLPIKFGFVHLPGLLRMKKGKPSGMSLDTMIKAVKIIINSTIAN